MAKRQTITYGIDFEVKDTGLKSVQKELQKIKSLSLTDFSKMTGKAPTKELTAELNKVNKAARVAEQALRAAYNPKLNSYNIQTFNKYLQQSGFNAQTLRAELVKAGPAGENAFRSAINSVTKFNAQIKETHTILNKIGTTLANTIKWNISSSLMNGVTQSIQQAWGFAKNLDSSLNDIRVVTGKSADEMARFAERANAVASNLGKGTTDYTRAALIYAQQGLGDKEVESRTAVTLKAANVTGQSTEAVSEELTAVWNGYKASAEQAELYVDRLAAVASTTASNLQELSTGMSKVASAAAAMGVGEEQLAAQLSTIISVTKQAPESVGTALRTVYARITDIKAGVEEDGTTLGQYSGKMAQMGINVLDAAGNLRDMGTVMEEIGAKWGTMTREQQVYLAQTMAGQRQYSNLVALFDNFDKYNSALETAQNAEGTLAAQNEIHMESLSAHLQQLTTQTEDMWMHLMDTDGIKDLIDGLTSIVDKVDRLFTSLGGGQAILKSLSTIAMSLLTGPIAKGLNTTISNIKLVQSQKLENAGKAAFAQQHAQYLNQQGRTEQAKLYNQKADFFKKSQGTFSKEQMENINAHWTAAESAANQQDTAKAKMLKINNRAKQVVSNQTGKSQGQVRAEAEQYYNNMANQIMGSNVHFTPVDNEKEINNLNKDIEESQENIQEAKQKVQELLKNKKELQERLKQANGPFSPYENEQQKEKEQAMLAGIDSNIAEVEDKIKDEKENIEDAKAEIDELQSQFTWEPGEALDIFKAENIGDNADDELKSLSNRYENLLNRVAKARQQGVQEGSQEYKQLSNDIKKFSEDAANYAQKSAAEMADGYKAAAQDEKTAGQAAAQARKQAEQQAADAIRQERIQGTMQVISGFSMLQVSVENLGNSFKNALDTGDWESFVGAILTSAPMLISSLTQISGGWTKISSLMDMQIGKSAKVVAAKTAEDASSIANAAANMAQKTAKQASAKAAQHQAAANGEAAAADATQTINSTANAAANVGETATKGAGGVFKLGEALKGLGPILKSLGPLLIVLVVLEGLKKWGDIVQGLANKAVEANKKIIDSENEKQEQLRKQEDVIKEVEDLNKQYEQGIITKTELKEKTEQLQQKYKDESTEIQQLVKNYKNLGQAAKQAKRKQSEQLEKSTRKESKAAANALDRKMETMHVREGADSWTGHMSAKISGDASIGGGWNWNNKGYAAQELGGMLAAEGLGGYVAGQNIISLSNAHNDQEAFQQLQILQKFVDNATEEQKESDAYKGAQEILDAMKQDIENYKNAAEQHFDALGKKIATQADIDFNKFDNLNDFSVEYKALAEDMRANFKAEHPEKTEEEIEEAVSKAMKENIDPEAYEKFGEKQQVLNKLDKNTNLGEIPNDIKSMIDALDSDQLDAFLYMDLENVKSYETIYKVLKKTSQLDFSNVGELTQANLNAATDKYTKVQQILEAIQQGKKISGKTLQESLTEQQIKENFESDVRGQYSIKAGKTLAEVANNLGAISVENFQTIYKDQLREIEKNKFYINNKNNNREYPYQESTQEKEEIKESAQAKTKTFNNLITGEAFRKIGFKYTYSPTDMDIIKRAISERREKLKNFLADQISLNRGNMTKETAQSLSRAAQDDDWETVTNIISRLQVDDTISTKINKNKDWQNTEIKQIENEDVGKNSKNIQPMIDFLLNFADDDKITKNIAKLYQYKENAQNNKTTKQEFQEVVSLVEIINDKYKDANKNLKNIQEKSQETLQQIHDGLFPIDKDVNETIVIQLGEQFQLTAQKSELLDNALKDNARQAREVAEQVQRYDAALKSVIKNYANWLNVLQNGSTAEKLTVAPQIKNSIADTLGISDNVISNSFATTIENLENMRKALQGDKQAYKDLQATMYEDIIAHVGLDDKDLIAAKGLIEHVFDDIKLDDIKVGATLDDAQVQKVLNKLIKMGIGSAETLEAIFATYYDVDLDVDIIDGKAEIASLTKAAAHELKQQQKSAEELKKAERDRIKSQQKMTEYLRDNRDLYHQINILLKDQERIISRITKNQSEMYGTELIDNLNAESRELSKQNKLYQQKQKMAKQFAADKRVQLLQYGAAFDQNGNISNYNQLKANSINQQNALIGQENGLKQIMNNYLLNGGNTSDEQYQDWQFQQTQISNQLQDAKQQQTILDELLNGYESDKQIIQEMTDKLTEAAQRQIEIRLQKFDMKVKIALDLSEVEKAWNDYKRNILQHDDILNPDNVKTILKDSAQYFSDALAGINYLPTLTDNLQKAIDEANKFNDVNYDPAQDPSAIFKTQGQARTYLQQTLEKVNSQSKDILSNIDEIKNKILDLANELKNVYDKQEQHLTFIREQINHNISLSKLLYGEESYKNLNKYYDQLKKYNLQSVADAKSQQEMFLELYQKETNQALKDIYLENYKQATKTLNSILESSLQDLKTRYENVIDGVLKNTKERLGFTYNTGLEWDLMKKQNDAFLDNVNSVFAIKNTEFLYNQALNDIDSISAQQKLKKVMDQQLEILKEKEKLTQYDVDRAQKVLDIEKARIALEEAQNNKTNMRLKRDSQGNYSYQYVADQDEIAKAQNDLQKAQNDLYNFDKENYIKNLDQAQQLYEEYAEKIKEIKLNDNLTEQEQIKAIALLNKDFNKRGLNIWKQNEFIKKNLMDSTANSLKIDLGNMSEAERNYLMGQSIPMWDSAAQEILNKFINDPNSVQNELNNMYLSLNQAQNDYEISIEETLQKAGTSYEDFKNTAIDPVIKSMETLIKDNNKLAEDAEKIVDKMQPLKTTLEGLTTKWDEMKSKIEQVNEAITEYLRKMGQAALAAQNSNDSEGDSNNNGGTGFPGISKLPSPGAGSTSKEEDPKKQSPGLATDPQNKKDPNTNNKIAYMTLEQALQQEGVPKFWDEISKADMPQIIKDTIRGEYTKAKSLGSSFGYSMYKALSKSKELGGVGFLNQQIYGMTQDIIKNIVFKAANRAAKSYGWGNNYVKRYGYGKNYVAHVFSNQKDLMKDNGLIEKFWSSFDTGGYTGSWNSPEGKIAMLHQKELVLNKQDTKNILNAVSLVRTITSNLTSNLISQINNIDKIKDTTKSLINDKNNEIEQNVKIQANFPNVNSKQEIEDAFAELVNMAAQRALERTRKK